ncbi:MAG: alpha/beta hydrolase [Bdellovibrionota bacterium]|nr:alpha/beta hydrolase [Bdellovibrionota bacterium]
MKFKLFSALDLREHKVMEVLCPTKDGRLKQWQVNYLAFAQDKFPGIAPLVILGGAFQKFHSFKKEVEKLCEHMPVILVDLPGQGGNDQIATELSFTDYADILKAFVDKIKIPKITPVALSYGSAIGFTFAGKYPENTERLILGGTTPKLRDSVRFLLEESIIALDAGRMKDFSTGVILNLFNYSQRKRTKVPRMLIRGFHKSLMALTDADKERYRSNTQRLLNLNGLEDYQPQCETLVIAGEFDNFTTPSECLSVARMCKQSLVGILRNCDHLAPFVKKDLMINVYKDFALHGHVTENEGISLYHGEEIPLEKKILEPRWSYSGEVILRCPETGWNEKVDLINVNSYGLCLNFPKVQELCEKRMKKLEVFFTEEDLSFETIFFERGLEGMRGIFKRYDFDKYDRLETFLKRLGEKQIIFRPASL